MTPIRLLFPRLFLEFISLLKEVITFKWGHAFAILRSWMWILSHLILLKKRRDIQKSDNIKIPKLIFQKSIVVKYFIGGNRKYTQIKN